MFKVMDVFNCLSMTIDVIKVSASNQLPKLLVHFYFYFMRKASLRKRQRPFMQVS